MQLILTNSEADVHVTDILQSMIIIIIVNMARLNNIRFNFLWYVKIQITLRRAVHRNVALNSLCVLYPSISLLRVWHAENKSAIFQTLVGRRLAINDPQTYSLPATRKTPAEEVVPVLVWVLIRQRNIVIFFNVTFGKGQGLSGQASLASYFAKGTFSTDGYFKSGNFYPKLFWQTENSLIDSMTTDFSPKDISAFGPFRHFCPFGQLGYST